MNEPRIVGAGSPRPVSPPISAKPPSVSVIIVNWNHGHLLQGCLDALLAQDYSPFDVTIVDNGSQDGSPEWIARRYLEVQEEGRGSRAPGTASGLRHLWAFPDNRGFSRAFNWGVSHTKGDFVLSLNPDAIVRDRFILEMVQAMCQDERIGMVAPKLLKADDPTILDSTGLFIDRRRRPYDRGQGEVDPDQVCTPPSGPVQGRSYVFGACGAAALYRRTMLEDLALDGEYLDEDFWAYYEDADLAWRAQARAWYCVYAPRAVATHARGWGDTLRKKGRAAKDSTGPRLALRNRYLMTIKNDALIHFLSDLPWILAAELPRLLYAALTRPKILLGISDLVRMWPLAMRKRQQIRSRQTVDDTVIRRWFLSPADSGRE